MVDKVTTTNLVVGPHNPQGFLLPQKPSVLTVDEYFFNPKPRPSIALAGVSTVVTLAGRQAVAQRMAAYAAAQAAEEFLARRAVQAVATRVVTSAALATTKVVATEAVVGGAAAVLTWGAVATAAAIGLGVGALLVGGLILAHYHFYENVYDDPTPEPQPWPHRRKREKPSPFVWWPPENPYPVDDEYMPLDPDMPFSDKKEDPFYWNGDLLKIDRHPILDPPFFRLPWGESNPMKNGAMLMTEIGGSISGDFHPTKSQRRMEREVARRMREEMKKGSVAIRSSRDWRIFSRLVPKFFPDSKIPPHKRDYFKFVLVREINGRPALNIGRIVIELPTGKIKHTSHPDIARNIPNQDAMAVGFGNVGPNGEFIVFPQQSACYRNAKTGEKAAEAVREAFDKAIKVRYSGVSRPMDPDFLRFGEFMNWAYDVSLSE